jgi:hypothetical protein
VLAYFSRRNKLAFGIELNEDELQRVYDGFVANPNARRSVVWGFALAVVPFAGLLTLGLGWSAFRKARARSWPPIENGNMAQLGMVLGMTTAFVWLIVVALLLASA